MNSSGAIAWTTYHSSINAMQATELVQRMTLCLLFDREATSNCKDFTPCFLQLKMEAKQKQV
jgi:hypothetical protein